MKVNINSVNEVCQKFINEGKTWKISPIEIQVSYDVVNLYPSASLDKAIGAIVESLKNDFNNVTTRTKFTLVDIHQLIELCVSECCFHYNDLIWKLYNSSLIGLWSFSPNITLPDLKKNLSLNLLLLKDHLKHLNAM